MLTPRVPVTHHALEQIQRMILSGAWREGQRLPSQRELAEQLRVSRASLREALSALESLGFLKIAPGRGVFVMSEEERRATSGPERKIAGRYSLLDVFQVRYVLESLAVSLVAALITDDELSELGRIVKAMKDAAENRDLVSLSEMDLSFHSLIFRLCRNAMLQEMAERVRRERDESSHRAFADRSLMFPPVEEHERIIDALATRDPLKARAAMEWHVRQAAARAGIDLQPVAKLLAGAAAAA